MPEVVTVIDCVVSLVDQRFPVEEDDVNTTEPPAQNLVGPLGVIVGTAGKAYTVTTVAKELPEEHPAKICSTVYEPLLVTVIDCVVSPVDQRFPLEAEEVSMTEPPSQKVVGPAAVIVGTEGTGFTVTFVGELNRLVHPFEPVICTV